MPARNRVRVRLIDRSEGPQRTTATLVASLAARLASLYFVSGADVIGSITAGFCALGREASRTVEGARIREAIEKSMAGSNGHALWDTMRISEWVATMPASPILDQLRNDLALLLSDDLKATLQFMPIPSHRTGLETAPPQERGSFVDCVLGMWAFSRELLRAVDQLLGPGIDDSPLREVAAAPESPKGPVLR
jgi:hypothetical protein